MMTAFILAICLSVLTALPTDAKTPLRDVGEIDDGLLAVAIADEMRKNCDTLDARLFRAFGMLQNLKQRAKELGYTSEEIEAYVSSAEEKARMRARGESWFKDRGVAIGDYEQYCALGAQEVLQGTTIGRLLRQK